MSRAYLYMEHPQTGAVITLGRLPLQGKVGEFLYAPDYVASKGWVPTPSTIRCVLKPIPASPRIAVFRASSTMPCRTAGGERLLHRVHGQGLTTLDFLLKSPNNDRIGNLMVGRSASPAPGLGSEPVPTLRGLAKFVEACEAVYDSQLDQESVSILNLRQQRSSLGGARPKRTLQDHGMLILAKPRDRFDQYDLPAVEYACMTFAASKGLKVARTALHAQTPSTLLVERFDRTPLAEGGSRIPMLSALTLLDAEWMTRHDWRYAGVADEMRRRGVPHQGMRPAKSSTQPRNARTWCALKLSGRQF